VWLEKSLWYRLAKHHRQIVALLDEMFPQKVQDLSTPGGGASADRPLTIPNGFRNDPATQLVETVHQQLGSMVSALTTVSQSLAQAGTGDSLARNEQLASDIGKAVQKSLRPLLDPLVAAVRALSDSLELQRRSVKLTSSEMNNMFDQLRNHLDHERSLATAIETHQAGTARAGWTLPRLRRSGPDEARAE